jgi:hypothetical protein
MIKVADDTIPEEHNVAEHTRQSADPDRNTTNVHSLHNRFVVAAIDFHRTRVYAVVQGDDGQPEKVLDVDPEGHSREIAHKAGNPNGTYENGNPEYWREITDALRPAAEILLLGHGNGKANASHQWVAYVEKHDHDVAAKVVADVRADIDDLTTGDVLARARHYFGLNPERYYGRDPGTAAPEGDASQALRLPDQSTDNQITQ